jgi:hypothetical protein
MRNSRRGRGAKKISNLDERTWWNSTHIDEAPEVCPFRCCVGWWGVYRSLRMSQGRTRGGEDNLSGDETPSDLKVGDETEEKVDAEGVAGVRGPDCPLRAAILSGVGGKARNGRG